MQFRRHISEHFFKSQDLNQLPPRVQQSLREREWANEVLVRIIQLVIVVMFIALYSFAAKTSKGAEFQPVPYVLSAYLIASIIGLVWSIRAELPKWSIYGSILIDFCLLYSLIISFHYQYEQPASFVLKAPTLLYVFIFIALRALRLEWKYVAAAGLTAAIGWLGVIHYVINIDANDTMITRSYVEYLTSNSILIGAEIDKIISILAVTIILALVVNASSNLLVTAVSEQAAANNLSRFFDKSIAEDIRGSADLLVAGQGVRRELAVINIDIRGFSKMAAKRDASDVMRLLSAYQGRVVPLLQENNAVIDKFMGDGIMATIGINGSVEDISRTALEAAEAIMADSRNWREAAPEISVEGDVKIGIGIAQGPVSFGAVGQGDRLEMTVIGAAVNTSAKLEKANKMLGSQCIVSRDVWEDAITQGYQGKLEAQFHETEIEGIEELQCVAVLSLKPQET